MVEEEKNNKWMSLQEGPCYFTYYLDIPENFNIAYLSLTQLLAAQAIINTINNDRVKAKWPNDIYVDGKFKVGGILTKSSGCGKKFKLQIGIGLNTKFNKSPNDSSQPITHTLESLKVGFLDDQNSNFELIDKITKNIFKKIYNNGQKFDLESFKQEYTKIWIHNDQIVDIYGEKGQFKVVGIDDSGYLLVESLETGQRHSVDPANNRFDMMAGMILQK